jgi:FtsP/CotA-like multicopper oxidase with cupredoxin domain
LQWTINGHIFPDMPVFVVERGELVKVEIVNNTSSPHPMHLHGHHMLVLSRDGRAVSGSPWWSDTLEVEPHERYQVAFKANNPGIWMDHCHNLKHAAAGLTMHLAYVGVATPYTIGGPAHNHPE